MAVKVELGNGKTVMMSLEDYLNLDEQGIQKLIASDAGMVIEDPFVDFDVQDSKRRTYTIPDIDEYIEPLPDDEVEKIKKQIKDG